MKVKDNQQEKQIQEKKLADSMIEIYCRRNHGIKGQLCKECQELSQYMGQRIDRCPFMETKTFCSACKVHCYSPAMREKIKGVMRYAGPWMLLYHPVMAVRHMKITLKEKREVAVHKK